MDNALLLYYERGLRKSLALLASMNTEQVEAVTKKYRALASKVGVRDAYKACIDSYSSECAETSLASLEDELKKALEGQMFDINPCSRMIQKAETHNKNLAKMSVDIRHDVNLDQLAPHQKASLLEAQEARKLQNLEVKAPKLAFDEHGVLIKPFYYHAIVAKEVSFNKKKVTMEIEVINR